MNNCVFCGDLDPDEQYSREELPAFLHNLLSADEDSVGVCSSCSANLEEYEEE